MDIDFRKNNLDWLRLLFASQVMLIHAYDHLAHKKISSTYELLEHFPGVPAFFFASGFLIYASFEKSRDLRSYFFNRFFRLFPGLIFATIGGLILIISTQSDYQSIISELPTYLAWFIAQVTLGQAWNPDIFRHIGVGVINGALWTITVEILFYISIPIIFCLEKFHKHIVLFLTSVSFLFYAYGESLLKDHYFLGKHIFAYLELTPIVWGWMFLVGTLSYKYLSLVKRYLQHFYLGLIPVALLIYLDLSGSVLFNSSGNRLGLLYFIFISATILYFAFRLPAIKLPFDLSYGIYIWHMVVINFFLVNSISNIYLMVITVIGLASLSWLLVEKPALSLKRRSLRL